MKQEKKGNDELSREEIRNEFLEAERERLLELKKNPKFLEVVKKLKKMGTNELYDIATKKMDDIENFKVAPEDLEKVETEILAIFTALEGLERERERIRDDYPDDDRDDIGGEFARRKRRSEDMER